MVSEKWSKKNVSESIVEFKIDSWEYFSEFISVELLNFNNYFFRGQGDSNWKLEPTLDRIIKEPESKIRDDLLYKFKLETRGRRGINPSVINDDNDWWALGQHHGLATPLLDWTESPFVALYFAVSNALHNQSKSLSVFALTPTAIVKRSELIKSNKVVELINGNKPTAEIIRPLSDENARLVSQRGLFTRTPNNIDLETWIKNYPSEETSKYIELAKLVMPSENLEDCLKYLNRMNINHSTLFPDLGGASQYCNMYLNIPSY